ncbi:unnamed protein product, partial [Choristocarpus tenellus]
MQKGRCNIGREATYDAMKGIFRKLGEPEPLSDSDVPERRKGKKTIASRDNHNVVGEILDFDRNMAHPWHVVTPHPKKPPPKGARLGIDMYGLLQETAP